MIFESEDLFVGVFLGRDTDRVTISFSSLILEDNGIKKDSWNSFRFGFREKWLLLNDESSIFFVSKYNNWYESESLDGAVAATINHEIFKRSKYKVLHGVSMGGYCALLLCNSLGADALFLGSPQLSIDFGIAHKESRWIKLRKKIKLLHNNAIEELQLYKGKKYIFVDPLHKEDMAQLHLAGSSLSLDDLYFLNGAGHMALIYMSQLGILDSVTKKILQGEDPRRLLDNVVSVPDKKIDDIKNILELPETADMCRELAILFQNDKNLYISLLEKAVKDRPYGPVIKKMYAQAKSDIN